MHEESLRFLHHFDILHCYATALDLCDSAHLWVLLENLIDDFVDLYLQSFVVFCYFADFKRCWRTVLSSDLFFEISDHVCALL